MAYRDYPPSTEAEAIARLKLFKKQRNKERLRVALDSLWIEVKEGKNMVQPTVEAVKSGATLEEIMSTIRKALGYDPDPYNVRDASSVL